MKTKIILTLTLVAAVTIGLVTSLADNKKINPNNFKVNIETIYLEDPNDPKCLAAILAEARKATSSILQEGNAPIYKHDPECQTGVFLEDKDGAVRCSFCNRLDQ